MSATESQSLADAAEGGRVDEVRSILSKHPALLQTLLDSGDSILHIACYQKHEEVVKLLLALGADVNRPGLHSMTPLHCAVSDGDASSTPLVRRLLDAGADPNALDLHERTPLDIAVGVANEELEPGIQLLLERGADWSPWASLLRQTPEQLVESLNRWRPRLSDEALRAVYRVAQSLSTRQDPMAVLDTFSGSFDQATQEAMREIVCQSPPPRDTTGRFIEHARRMAEWLDANQA